jgi:hypothetical protein
MMLISSNEGSANDPELVPGRCATRWGDHDIMYDAVNNDGTEEPMRLRFPQIQKRHVMPQSPTTRTMQRTQRYFAQMQTGERCAACGNAIPEQERMPDSGRAVCASCSETDTVTPVKPLAQGEAQPW